MHKRASWLAAFALAIAAAGCAGSDGATGATGAKGDQGDLGPAGPQGPAGPTGPAGPAGPVTQTNESCAVCHASDRLWPTESLHALPFPTGTQQNINVTVVSAADSGGKLAVTFDVTDNTTVITNVGTGDMRVVLAAFVPGATAAQSDYFQRWAMERTGTFDPDGTGTAFGSTAYPLGTLQNLGGGRYTYTTAALLAAAPTAVNRFFIRVGKTGKNTGNATYDFNTAAPATRLATQREIVPTAVCNSCHVDRIADHGHGGGYNKVEACDTCHSPLLDESPFSTTPHDMQALKFDMTTMIHQIHAAIDSSAAADASGHTGVNWGEITYPGIMKNCTQCHTGGADSANYKTKPSRAACGSCHTNVDFAAGIGHAVKTDATCFGCHEPADIDLYHAVLPDPAFGVTVAPEFQATIAMTPPGNGQYYVAGEAPVVTVTLKDAAGNDVPGTLYTTAKQAAGIAGGGLAAANLYVYGPREAPRPVLTTGAAKTPLATQAQALFVGGTDAKVLTDATGFKYQLDAIPAGMKAGTYFVRFLGQDYGYKSGSDYVAASNDWEVFQIGTTTASKKIAGDCTRCHGNGPLIPHIARHGVEVYDTDVCIGCHDLSGNYADPLANRVHAVHAATLAGDEHNRDWREIAYPAGTRNGGVKNCAVCHSSGNTQYKTNVAGQACRGCHGDNLGAIDHMQQNGY